jgi:hypothetical protein
MEPDHAPLAVQLVAFWAFHVNVDDVPTATFAGETITPTVTGAANAVAVISINAANRNIDM